MLLYVGLDIIFLTSFAIGISLDGADVTFASGVICVNIETSTMLINEIVNIIDVNIMRLHNFSFGLNKNKRMINSKEASNDNITEPE